MGEKLEDSFPIPSKKNGITPYDIAREIRESGEFFGEPVNERIEYNIKTCKCKYSFEDD